MEYYPMTKKIIKKLLQIAIISFIIGHFFTAFYHVHLFEIILSIFALVLFTFSAVYITTQKFKLPLTIFIAAIIILILSEEPVFKGVLNGLIIMRSIVGFLVFIPLIGWVLREEPYIEDIISVFYKFVNTSRRFYYILVVFTQ